MFYLTTGEEIEVKRLSVRGLLPETDYYMTYDGSTTMPACHETVTWLILNKPIYITKQQVHFVTFNHSNSPSSPFCLTVCVCSKFIYFEERRRALCCYHS